MNVLDASYATPAANLAADEALANACEHGDGAEVLRFWEPVQPFVVVGYANHVSREVNLDALRAAGIPVLRRVSGGGTVLQLPGSVNYTLVLKMPEKGPLLSIPQTNEYIMQRHRAALQPLVSGVVQVKGVTDLTLDGRKFSGNAQRRWRRCILFHGTVLLQSDLSQIERVLSFPSRQPDYRENRSHTEFITNLGIPVQRVKQALSEAWQATEAQPEIPMESIQRLVQEKYEREDWNWKFP